LYLDSSALVSLYAFDDHSSRIQSVVAPFEKWSTSLVTLPEVQGVLARKMRGGALVPARGSRPLRGARGARRYGDIVAEFRQDWGRFMKVPLDGKLADSAGLLAAKYALKGFDAVHLASALAVASDFPEPVALLSADVQLSAAARVEGITPL
jgi:predicted nucleic acid-binding protein